MLRQIAFEAFRAAIDRERAVHLLFEFATLLEMLTLPVQENVGAFTVIFLVIGIAEVSHNHIAPLTQRIFGDDATSN